MQTPIQVSEASRETTPTEAQPEQKACAFPPRTAADSLRLGQMLQRQGKREEAAICYRQALLLDPSDLKLWHQIGTAFRDLQLFEQAVFCFRHIADRLPQIAEASACLGSALREMGRFEEAAHCFRQALALKPGQAAFHNSLGIVLREIGQIEEATAQYHQALILDPGSVNARWNLGIVQLLEGNFTEGWRNYEARWQKESAPHNFAQPLWRGEPLEGARILLHAEQGLGDTIQFLRFVPQVEAAGGRVILGLPEDLRALAKGLHGLSRAEFAEATPTAFDWHAPLMSLPRALGTTLDTVPAQVPYLSVPDEARARARALPWPTGRLRVGLVWSGSPEQPHNRDRALPLAHFKNLLKLEEIQFFSLQMGAPAKELAPWRNKMTDLTPAIGNLTDTAALMEELDLILTVDTMAAHLAGALGLPVWLLLCSNNDWRWMRYRLDSPWYPTMRLFRQTSPGNWQSALEQVRAELAARSATGFHPARAVAQPAHNVVSA